MGWPTLADTSLFKQRGILRCQRSSKPGETATTAWLLVLTTTVLATTPPVEATETETSPDLAPEEVVRIKIQC